MKIRWDLGAWISTSCYIAGTEEQIQKLPFQKWNPYPVFSLTRSRGPIHPVSEINHDNLSFLKQDGEIFRGWDPVKKKKNWQCSCQILSPHGVALSLLCCSYLSFEVLGEIYRLPPSKERRGGKKTHGFVCSREGCSFKRQWAKKKAGGNQNFKLDKEASEPKETS